MHHFFKTLRLFSRATRLYLITPALIGFTIFGGIYTVLLNLYLLRLGYNTEYVGLVNGIGFLALALSALPAGALGRYWGIQRSMVLGMTLMAVGCGLLPLAEFVPAFVKPAWPLVMFATAYVGQTLHIVNGQPFLMDVTTPAERDHVFSVQVALWPLAGFLGSLVGGALPGLLATLFGLSLETASPYRYPLLLAAFLLLFGVWAMYSIEYKERTHTQGLELSNSRAPFLLIAFMSLTGALRVGGENIGRIFFNVYLDSGLNIDTAQIGSVLAFAQLISVPLALLAPSLSLRWGRKPLMLLGTFGVAASMLPIALLPDWRAAAFGLLGIFCLTAISRGPFMIYLQEVIDPHWRSLMAGATTMTYGLSGFAVALGGGYVIPHWGYRTLFLIGAGLSLMGAVLLAGYLLAERKE